MIAKLVVRGRGRKEAVARLGQALDGFVVRGLATNLDFLAAVAGNSRFASGRLSTGFIADEFGHGFHGLVPDEAKTRLLVAVAATARRRLAERETTIGGQLPGHGAVPANGWVVALDDDRRSVSVTPADGGYQVEGQGWTHRIVTGWRPGDPVIEATVDGKGIAVRVDRRGARWRLSQGGTVLDVTVLSPRGGELLRQMPAKTAPDLSRMLLSPMPGLLVSVAVSEGEEVKVGQELAVVEAMKMENVLRAERDGRVARVHVAAGASLTVDQTILEFE